MSIKIYTYPDPYKLINESYWNEIKDCPQFCVSQTMVNGMEAIYEDLERGQQLTTIRNLINALYGNWEDINTRVRQMMETDHAISQIVLKNDENGNIRQSLEYNVKDLVNSIRLMKELGLDADRFDVSRLTVDQKCLIEIYKLISERQKSSFRFERVDNEGRIDEAIRNALNVSKKHEEEIVSQIPLDTIVIHGIHQFSPAMLCAIEDLSRYKTVILLFNYQEQYKAIYQTWLNIYSLFETKINMSTAPQFSPLSLYADSWSGNSLADSMGALANGTFKNSFDALKDLEVIEFENVTEFAGYCTVLFENARREQKKTCGKKDVLGFMSEQMYSASGKVNDILRAYYPEQFGERHFLDYPIGHFFIAITEMWDNERELVKVNDLSFIEECLSSGIISEGKHGKLLSTFNSVKACVEKETTLSGIISALKKQKKYVSPADTKLKRIGYLNVTKEELLELIDALSELEIIIIDLFKDFNAGGANFDRFYKKVHDFIIRRTQDADSLDNEMKEVIARLLARMDTVDLPDTGTFTCLKQTMSFYLSQDDSAGKGANWIVRDFEQIDGDILRSGSDKYRQDPDKVLYHFCCVSDKDISAARDERLPWPLDIAFFEYSYEPMDQKYLIFLKSKMEFRNFKKYALLYGLEFNRIGVKLSYVKTEDRKENELYHLIKMLGIKVTKYHANDNSRYIERKKYSVPNDAEHSFTETDLMKYKMCPYRFALESCVQERTIYRDRFLVIFYMRMLLQNMIEKKHQGKALTVQKLMEIMEEEYADLDNKFHIRNEYEKTQIIAGMIDYLRKNLKRRSRKSDKELDLKEDFLRVPLDGLFRTPDDPKPEDIIKITVRYDKTYLSNIRKYCMYCSSKDICLR